MRFDGRTIDRGVDYYLERRVLLARVHPTRIIARVRGTQSRPYTVAFDLHRPERSHCSCPVRYACKHLVAVIACAGNDARIEPDVRHRARSIAARFGILPDGPEQDGARRDRPVFSQCEHAAGWRLVLLVDHDYHGGPTVHLARQYRRKDGRYGRLDALHSGDVVFAPDSSASELAERLRLLGGGAPLVAFAHELLETRLPAWSGNPGSPSGAPDVSVRFIRPVHYEIDLRPHLPDQHVAHTGDGGQSLIPDQWSATLTVRCGDESFVVPPDAFGEFDDGLGLAVASFPEAGVVVIDDETSPLAVLRPYIGAFGRISTQGLADLHVLAAAERVSLRAPGRIRVQDIRPEPVFVLSVIDEVLTARLELQAEAEAEAGEKTDDYSDDEYVVHRVLESVPSAALETATELFGAEPWEGPRPAFQDEDAPIGPWHWSIPLENGTPDPLALARELSVRGFTVYIQGPGGRRRVRAAPVLSVHVASGTDWFAPVACEPGVAPLGEQQLQQISIQGGFDDGEGLVLFAEEAIERVRGLLAVTCGAPDLRLPHADIASLAELAGIADDVEPALDPVLDFAREILSGTEPRAPETPAGLTATLRPYQREGFAWLAGLARHGLSGCLADDMGLGKTLQALALMLHLAESPPLPISAAPSVAGSASDGPPRFARGGYLVIAPLSTLGNWQRETTRFAPSFSSRIHHGADRAEDPCGLTRFDLVVTSYATAVRDIALLTAVRWTLVVLDEAQAIKNPHTRTAGRLKTLPSDLRLCLTGTPVENVSTDLFSVMDFLVPGLLGSLASFSARFPRRNISGSSQSTERLARLRRIVAPFLLRRTKDAVAPELPPKIETTLECRMRSRQAAFYEKLRAYHHSRVRAAIASGDIGEIGAAVFTGLLRLRQAAIHPPAADPAGRSVPSVKTQELLDRLDEVVQEGHRALVFSQFVSALAAFHEGTAARGIATLYLDGQTRNRDELIARFQASVDPAVFFISLRAGGTGINLTAADHVFICDPWWNPQVERQAVDRAHRIGRDRPVVVTRLVTAGTVEEKVLELQKQKRRLAADLVLENSGGIDLRSAEELLSLFER